MTGRATEPGGEIVIGLGSNIGDRMGYLERAVGELEKGGVEILRRSQVYESRAWGVVDQPDFLNAAVAVTTDLTPRDLLKLLLTIEGRMGRVRHGRWGPRAIDLDLLVYGEEEFEEPGLTLPHAGIYQRDFVMEPLIDLGVLRDRMTEALGALPESERTIISRMKWKTEE